MTSTEDANPEEYKSILDTASKLQAKIQNLKRPAVKDKPKHVKRFKVMDPAPDVKGEKKIKKVKTKEENGATSVENDPGFSGKHTVKHGGKGGFVKEHGADEKTDWKELKKQKKLLKLQRQAKKLSPNFQQTVDQAKQLWITLTLKNLGKLKQQEVARELLAVVKDVIPKCVKKHDTSRFIQAIISKGSTEEVDAVFESLKDDLLEAALGKYSHWCVVQLLKHGNKQQRQKIISSFDGKVAKLMNNSVGCRVLEEAYNDHASACERARIVQELFSLDYKYSKDETVRTLQDAIEKKPDKKAETLHRLGSFLKKFITKNRWRLSIFHVLLYEYLRHAEEDEKQDILESVRENLLDMIHTKEGARVAMISLWQSDKKARKQIVKSFKEKVVEICKEAQGHRVLLALFDCVDDTVLVNKVIIQEILKNIADIMSSDSGRKVILYLVAHREKMFFDIDTVQYLSTGDKNPYTKKTITDIHTELSGAVVPEVVNFVSTNIQLFAEDNSKAFYLRILLIHIKERQKIFDSIAEYVANHDWNTVAQIKAFWKMIAYFLLGDQNEAKELATVLLDTWNPKTFEKLVVNFEGSALLCTLLLAAKGVQHDNVAALKIAIRKVSSGEDTVRKWLSAATTNKSNLDSNVKYVVNCLKK